MTNNVSFDANNVNVTYTYQHPDGADMHFQYSHEVEQYIARKIFNDNVIEFAPTGFCPDYDVVIRINGLVVKYDQKLVSHVTYRGQKGIKLELRYENGSPSSLLLTNSDYYLIVTPEYNKGTPKGKARLFSVPLLLNYCDFAIHSSERWCAMNPHDVEHVWLGDFTINSDNTWDLTQFNANLKWESQVTVYKNIVIKKLYPS